MVQTRSKTRGDEHGYEFFGPPGVLLMSIGLPILCYLFSFVCNDVSGCPAPSLLDPKNFSLAKLKKEVEWPGFEGLLNVQTSIAVGAYYALNILLWKILPAEEVEGTELSTGKRLKYRFNAFSTSLTILGAAAVGTFIQGPSFPIWDFIWNNHAQLITANLLFSFALAVFVYIRSFAVKPGGVPNNRELAKGGHSGNLIYDWFIGRELNPPIAIPFIGTMDIKSFMELRPGMLGWMLLNFAFMARQYKNYGEITDSMVIVCVSQAVYILDGQYMEPAILTTIDITTDGFGFMLSFGDLVWVPFIYSLQSRYLAVHPVKLGLWGCLGVGLVLGFGYWIFRSANNEKNRFRTNPNDPAVAHLEYITTKTGSKLLVSGWWGTARHINYLGDWVMSWAYSLPTGIAGYIVQPSSPFRFKTPDGGAFLRDDQSLRGGKEVVPGEARGWGMLITYFYLIYFAVLLIHRERRDEEKCRRKYGADWEKYTRRVPSRIVPGVY